MEMHLGYSWGFWLGEHAAHITWYKERVSAATPATSPPSSSHLDALLAKHL
eukprot:m.265145 g.265145  ORF g.265145 m.265145 type:complete len:51 (+) comp11057_c0_seq17:2460-2612(+)